MTMYSIIVLGVFVLMWGLCTYEINSKNRLIKKLDEENEDVTNNYNQLVSDYNDIMDFLEKHFSKEELDELFLEHDMDKFLVPDGDGMNEQVKEMIKEQLRDSL